MGWRPGTCPIGWRVAQALHWFKFDDFYTEVRRVCTAGAIIAVWCYAGFPSFGGEIDIASGRVLDALDPYWPAEVAYVKDNYKAIPGTGRIRPKRPVKRHNCSSGRPDVRRGVRVSS